MVPPIALLVGPKLFEGLYCFLAYFMLIWVLRCMTYNYDQLDFILIIKLT